MARWLESAIVWLVLCFLGLVLSIGGPATLGAVAGTHPSPIDLTGKGDLFPGAAFLSAAGIVEMLRKPMNQYQVERVSLGLFCVVLVVVAVLCWGVTLTLYRYNGPVDPSLVSGSSIWLYGFSVVVGGICIVRAEHR